MALILPKCCGLRGAPPASPDFPRRSARALHPGQDFAWNRQTACSRYRRLFSSSRSRGSPSFDGIQRRLPGIPPGSPQFPKGNNPDPSCICRAPRAACCCQQAAIDIQEQAVRKAPLFLSARRSPSPSYGDKAQALPAKYSAFLSGCQVFFLYTLFNPAGPLQIPPAGSAADRRSPRPPRYISREFPAPL